MRRVLQILNNKAEEVVVPKLKLSLSFSCGVSLSLEDIVSDGEEEIQTPGHMFDIKMCEIEIAVVMVFLFKINVELDSFHPLVFFFFIGRNSVWCCFVQFSHVQITISSMACVWCSLFFLFVESGLCTDE